MADLESANSNAFFEVLEEWNSVLEAERYLLEQALQADEDGDGPPDPDDGADDGPHVGSPVSATKKRGMGQ
ncbi:MAG: hypothetical protein AAFR39_08135 [Pseudomonadota bacterium]